MTTPDNIERFNAKVSLVFALLYEEFPNPMNLCPEHLGITKDLGGIPTWSRDDWEQVVHVLLWLTEEGYIRTNGYTTSTCRDAVLTQKGLTILRSIPDSVSGSAPMGERIKDAVTKGAGGLASKLAEQTLLLGIRAAIGQ